MLKVAIVSPLRFVTAKKTAGSIELLTSKLVDALISRNDIEVTLFASGDSNTSAELVPTIDKALNSFYGPGIDAATEIAAKKVLERAQEFDVIHSQLYARHTLKLLEGEHKVPVLKTLHSTIIKTYDPERTQDQIMKHAPIPYLTPISDWVRAPHPLLNYTATVYNGVNINEFPFLPTSKGDKNGQYWFFMGRIAPSKGAHYAIRTALKHNKRLKIAGPKVNNSSGQRYFHEMIKPYLGEQIQYLGLLGPEKAHYLGNASLVLLPSCCDEAFGLVTVEALLCGTPVLGTRRGAFPEIVSHEKPVSLPRERDALLMRRSFFLMP